MKIEVSGGQLHLCRRKRPTVLRQFAAAVVGVLELRLVGESFQFVVFFGRSSGGYGGERNQLLLNPILQIHRPSRNRKTRTDIIHAVPNQSTKFLHTLWKVIRAEYAADY